MALIGEIRKRSWLLIVLIGLAMAGFIFMDMFSGERSIFSSRRTSIGEINGESIDQREFERSYNALYSNSQGDIYQQRRYLWNFMVEDKLVRNEAKELGLSVPLSELEDLNYGDNLSPIIQERFKNPQTGQLNRENLNSFRDAELDGRINDPAQVDPGRKNFWYFQKREINKQRLQDKLGALVTKSLYTPNWMAEEVAKAQSSRVDMAFVKVPFTAISDDNVNLTDEDYNAFLAAEGARYERDEEGRTISYVEFPVTATQSDKENIVKRLAEIKDNWASAGSDSAFVMQNRGQFPIGYALNETLNQTVKDASVGSIVGPYEQNNSYVIAKVIGRQTVADSVNSRHILLKPGQTPEENVKIQALADSLTMLIQNGTNTFGELAKQFSQGPTGPKGGELGYAGLGAMVGPFNDLIFFTAKKGEINQVVTQFGLHIVEVTNRKFTTNRQGTRLATIGEAIEPSNETQNAVYEKASRFAQANRTLDAMVTAAKADPNLKLVENKVVSKSDSRVGELASGNSARDMVKFSFKNGLGTVSPNVYAFKAPNAFYNGQYVVMASSAAIPAGKLNLAGAKASLTSNVKNFKKAQMLGSGNMESLASTYGVKIDTARGISFNTSFIPQLGAEPKAIAEAFKLPLNQSSGPIYGNAGILVVQPLSKNEPSDVSAQIANAKRVNKSQVENTIKSAIGRSLRKNADIDDNRSAFY